MSAEELITISDRLQNWIFNTWSEVKVHREIPIRHRLVNGTLIEGTADLVLETNEGLVIIDHKTFPGNKDQCRRKALEFAGQLDAYVNALETATGKDVIGKYIYFPISGYVVLIPRPKRI